MTTTIDKEVLRSPRLQQVLDATERVFVDDTFHTKEGRRAIMGEMPNMSLYRRRAEKLLVERSNNGFDPELTPCFDQPLLTLVQEHHLFRQYNFWKHRARTYAENGFTAQAERYLSRAKEVRDILVSANTRLVASISKSIRSKNHASEVLSEGYLSLLKAVEGFDFTRGIKFSTYCTYVVRSAMIREAQRWWKNYPLPLSDDVSGGEGDDQVLLREWSQEKNVTATENLLRFVLSDRELQIIVLRYGLRGNDYHTLQEIADMMKLSKERVRQIQSRVETRMKEQVEIHGIEFEVQGLVA